MDDLTEDERSQLAQALWIAAAHLIRAAEVLELRLSMGLFWQAMDSAARAMERMGDKK